MQYFFHNLLLASLFFLLSIELDTGDDRPTGWSRSSVRTGRLRAKQLMGVLPPGNNYSFSQRLCAGKRAAREEQLQPVWAESRAELVCVRPPTPPREPVCAGTLWPEAGELWRWMALQHRALQVDCGHRGTTIATRTIKLACGRKMSPSCLSAGVTASSGNNQSLTCCTETLQETRRDQIEMSSTTVANTSITCKRGRSLITAKFWAND